MRLLTLSFICLMLVSCHSSKVSTNEKLPSIDYKHPIPFEPQSYVCYRTNEPILIDGKMEEDIWKKTPQTEDFQDIQGELRPQPPFQTYVKMLWDDEYFYFGAYLEEPHIWATYDQRDAVIFHENDFEIFIDPDGDTHHYFEFEINAINTIWDLMLLKPYRDKGALTVVNALNMDIKSAVNVQGTLNNATDVDSFWTIEMAIPLKALKEFAPKSHYPKDGVQWRVNFSRVNWHTDIESDFYKKKKDKNGKQLPEENWVWSPQGYINMHAPETWGFVQFSDKTAGQEKATFVKKEEEQIKWGLRQLYYQQRQYHSKHKKYATQLSELTMPVMDDVDFSAKLLNTFQGYQFIALSSDKKYYWIINETGQTEKYPVSKE